MFGGVCNACGVLPLMTMAGSTPDIADEVVHLRKRRVLKDHHNVMFVIPLAVICPTTHHVTANMTLTRIGRATGSSATLVCRGA